MKNLQVLFSVFLLTLLISCSSNDDPPADNSTRVKYQIVEMDQYVSFIRYKKGDGTNAELTDYTQFADDGVDSRTVSIPTHPFDAHMEVTINNTSGSNQTYTLAVYVDGELKDFEPMLAPAGAVYTKVIDYTVP